MIKFKRSDHSKNGEVQEMAAIEMHNDVRTSRMKYVFSGNSSLLLPLLRIFYCAINVLSRWTILQEPNFTLGAVHILRNTGIGGGGSSRFITVLQRGGLPNLYYVINRRPLIQVD